MKKYFILLLTVAAVLSMALSCSHGPQNANKQLEIDSLFAGANNAVDNERRLALCDSLEQTGDMSVIKAATYRGYVYQRLGKYKLEETEYRKALAETPKNHRDSLVYYGCATAMTDLLFYKANYEEALKLAIPTFENLKKMYSENPQEIILHRLQLLTQRMGLIQIKLSMKEEAEKSFETWYSYARITPLNFPYAYYNLAVYLHGIVIEYLDIKDYGSAEKWLVRQDSVVAMIAEGCGLNPKDSDNIMAFSYSNHAFLALGQDRPDEFMRALSALKNTQKAKEPGGRLDLADLLLESKRYAEAADEYAVLDQYYTGENAPGFSIDNLLSYGLKFKANYKAGRRDSALAVAAYIVENLDSAIAKEKNNAAAELATVYQTQQKDAEIAQQQITLSRQRWIGTLAALVLLTTFFIIYTLHRRRAQKRLAAAHQQLEAAHENLETAHTELQTAYDQLEETTTAKERIESELRIARNIQMSMVPGVFPEREGLDMYAEMTPAKEVGGDLYGYVLQGDMLYFCVGDVSGKGVPASLFMAQSARLFRTLAAEGMMPADIATRMNNELVEGNDSFMFVTMFIGLLHLDTGRLDFCNCGHNAPVYDGQFLKMQYVNQMIGVLEGAPFYGESIEDIRNHQLLVYTDGLNEAENTQHELLGDDRLLELMADAQSLDSHQLIGMMKEAVEQHRNGAEPSDDLTLMCLKLQ